MNRKQTSVSLAILIIALFAIGIGIIWLPSKPMKPISVVRDPVSQSTAAQEPMSGQSTPIETTSEPVVSQQLNASPEADPRQIIESPITDVVQMDSLAPEMIQEIFLAQKIEGNFHTMIQRVAPDVPEIAAAVGDEPVKWHTLQFAEAVPLHERNKKAIGIFKFRSNLKTPADLHWAFAIPEGRSGEWYIVPAKATMQGFEKYQSDRMIHVSENSYAPGNLYVFQELVGGHILPGEEYLIWYIPPDGVEKEMRVALKLTETGNSHAGKSAEEIRDVMGIHAQRHEFTQTSDGLRNALETVHRILLNEPTNIDSIGGVLRQIWNQLPYLDVNESSGPTVWNRLTPKLSSRFQAFRIKTAGIDAADLDWCFVIGGELVKWGFVSRDPQFLVTDQYGIELNLPLPEVANAEKNVAVFQRVSQGQLRGNNEYAVWFMPAEGILSEIDATLRLIPNESPTDASVLKMKEIRRREKTVQNVDPPMSAQPADVRTIGRGLGIDVPEIPSTERIANALELCQQLILTGQMRSIRFEKLMQFAIPGLPELDLESVTTRWTKIDLNQNGRRLVGYRIGSKWKIRGQIAAVVARPPSIFSQLRETYFNKPRPLSVIPDNERAQGLVWGNLDDRQPGIHIAQRRSAGPLTMLDPAIPADSIIDYDLDTDWDFEKYGPYVILFSPVTHEPMTVNLAVKVEKISLTGPRGAWQSNNGEAPNDVTGVLGWMGLREGDPVNPGILVGRHKSDVRGLRFIDADTIVSGDADDNVITWDVHDPAKPKQIPDTRNNPWIKALSPDGRFGASYGYFTSQLNVEEIGKADSSIEMNLPDVAKKDAPNSLSFSFSPDGNHVVGNFSGHAPNSRSNRGKESKNCWVCIWDRKTGERITMREIKPLSPVREVCWLRDGRIAAVGSEWPSLLVSGIINFNLGDSGIKIPTSTGHFMILDSKTLKTESDASEEALDWNSIQLSADGTSLVAFTANGYLRFLNPENLEAKKSLASNMIQGRIALSRDGRRVAIRGVMGEIQVWDVDLGRVLSCGNGDLPLCNAAVVSPTGEWLAVADKDRNLKLFKIHPADQPDGKMTVELERTDSFGMKFNWIPSGRFHMGRSQSGGMNQPVQAIKEDTQRESQKPRHIVQITKPFYMGSHEVTVAQFRKFVDATGYQTTAETSGQGGQHILTGHGDFQNDPKFTWKNPGFPQEENHPVVQVSYVDATAFCDWLSKQENAKYRLPTEAEWEYACRAGTTSSCYYGGHTIACRCANIPSKELAKAYGKFGGTLDLSDGYAFTSPVGSYIPNGYGLHDMLGNVWEWCSDWYSEKYYAASPMNDPQGPGEGTTRIQRGGSFLLGQPEADWRDQGPPDQGQSAVGFRVVREIESDR